MCNLVLARAGVIPQTQRTCICDLGAFVKSITNEMQVRYLLRWYFGLFREDYYFWSALLCIQLTTTWLLSIVYRQQSVAIIVLTSAVQNIIVTLNAQVTEPSLSSHLMCFCVSMDVIGLQKLSMCCCFSVISQHMSRCCPCPSVALGHRILCLYMYALM